jgi:hypothetical protein
MTHANGCWSPPQPDEDELVRAVDASAALRQLLAAASAPPSAAELQGQSRAVADFRAAHRPTASASGPGTEPTRPAHGGQLAAAGILRAGRWSTRLVVACTALAVLLGGTAATAAVREFPKALRNAVSDLFPYLRRPPPLTKVRGALLGRTAASPLPPGWGRPTAYRR